MSFPSIKQDQIWRILRDASEGSLSIIGYGGAAGGGKTRAIAELAIDWALKYPGTRILIARRDLADLKTTTRDEFFRCIDPRLITKRHDSENWVRIKTAGAETTVYFKELKDWMSIASEQYSLVCLDEAGEIPEQAIRMLITRMREPNASKYAIVCASNPWPGWYKRWFIDRELDDANLEAARATVTFVPAYMGENPGLPANYEAQLRATLPPDWVDRFVEGRWDAFVGQVYPELNQVHVWKHDPPNPVSVYGGLDFGGQNPFAHMTAGMVGVLTEKRELVLVAEFEANGAEVYEKLLNWMSLQEKAYGPIRWRADKSQMFGIELLRRRFSRVNETHGGADSVAAGIGLVRKRLKASVDGNTWGLYYLPSLRQFPRRMETYRWEEPRSDDSVAKQVPLKRDDDLCDATRYMVEECDGFPSDKGPLVRNATGRRLATRAV